MSQLLLRLLLLLLLLLLRNASASQSTERAHSSSIVTSVASALLNAFSPLWRDETASPTATPTPTPNGEAHTGETHTCVHGLVAARNWRPMRVVNVSYGDNARRKRDLVYSPLRVFFDMTYVNDNSSCTYVGQKARDQGGALMTCKEEDVLTQAKGTVLLDLLEKARVRLTETFAVVPTVDALKLDAASGDGEAATCGIDNFNGLKIPSMYATTGRENTDLIVFVTTRPVSGTVRAYAFACLTDVLGRPVAGIINFGPSKLVDSSSIQVNTMIHELMHVLGMSSSSYSRFINENTGATYTKPTTVKSTLPNTKPVTSLVTPKVLEAARAHFNCSTMTGVELEESDENKPPDHWEKRILGNELMTAVISEIEAKLSVFTLALMEDSGWYRVNYARADSLIYGRGFGCQQLTESCSTWTSAGYEPCPLSSDTNDAEYCAFDQIRFGKCSVSTAVECLPIYFRTYESDCKKAGDRYADFCVIATFSKSCQDAGDARSDRGETYGPASRCFHANSGSGFVAHCFSFTCKPDNSLDVVIGGQTVNCVTGGTIVAAGTKQLRCPDPKSMCCACQNGGRCVNGKCICPSSNGVGYKGEACETPVPQWSVVPSPTSPAIGSFDVSKLPTSAPLNPSNPLGISGVSNTDFIIIIVGLVLLVVVIIVIVVMVCVYKRKKSGEGFSMRDFMSGGSRARANAMSDNFNGGSFNNGGGGVGAFNGGSFNGGSFNGGSFNGGSFNGGGGGGSFNGSGASFNAAAFNGGGGAFDNNMMLASGGGDQFQSIRRGGNDGAPAFDFNSIGADCKYLAICGWEHQAASSEEISVPKGATVEVIDDAHHWYLCRYRGLKGKLPSSYIQRIGGQSSASKRLF